MSLCGDSIFTRTKNVKYCLICYEKTDIDKVREIEVYIYIYH